MGLEPLVIKEKVLIMKERFYSEIQTIIFKGKQNISWDKVEDYLKQYIGKSFIVEEYQDIISIASDFPDEYAESVYTKKLRGALAKVKANAVQIIDSLIIHATNKRWVENKAEKHNQNAAEGWLRYDTYFSMPVQGSQETGRRVNQYIATLIVRKTVKGSYLYDIINIKKEACTPLKS